MTTRRPPAIPSSLESFEGTQPPAVAGPVTPERILAYYRECWGSRLWSGHHSTSRAMHLGLFAGADASADDPQQADEARLRLDEHVADAAGLDDRPARVLDAGSGIGGTALHLARRHPGVRVTGVELSPEHVWMARQLVDAAGLGPRVLFLPRSFLDTGLPDGSFDVVLALESLGHCTDRPGFAREAFRLLAPGGCLVLCDLCRSPRQLDSLEAACYAAVIQGWVVADCFTRPPAEVFGAAGFVEPWCEDLTDRVLPGLRRSSTRASALLQSVRLPPRRRAHERACVAAHALCQRGAVRYVAFRARKPRGEVSHG